MIGYLLSGLGSGEYGGAFAPVAVFASEDEAYEYQFIGSELGIPWELAILADGMKAYEEGKEDLSDYNPILTSLEFCILVEKEMIPETVSEGDASVSSSDAEAKENENSEESDEPVINWIIQTKKQFKGKQAILKYISEREEGLTYTDVNSIVTAINKICEEKSSDDKKYEAVIVCNADYEGILRKLGISDENIENVMVLYNASYISHMYGYNSYAISNYDLPDIVVGDVTRADLAKVAVSIIGHPYLMGGKSTAAGAPTSPLDCSGFVDWVYFQCFGTGASKGNIPEGVAVSGTALQWYASVPIKQSELKVGDLGFYRDPAASSQINHVGIYLGTYNGRMYWIHCGGSTFGTDALPKGRVGISVSNGYNSYNPVDGSYFEPSMKKCNFKFYRRPQFQFAEEGAE